MTITGDWAICAFLTAVSVLVTPGPAVTAATPGRPVRRAVASAAKTAVASWRVSITRMPARLAATRIGEICPPTRVKRNGTPCAFKTSAMSCPPFMRPRVAFIDSNRSSVISCLVGFHG